MAFQFNLPKNQLIFSGEVSIFDIDATRQQILDNISQFKKTEPISIQLEELEKIDSAGIQLLLSLQKTFSNQVVYTNIPFFLKEILSRHGFRFSKINPK